MQGRSNEKKYEDFDMANLKKSRCPKCKSSRINTEEVNYKFSTKVHCNSCGFNAEIFKNLKGDWELFKGVKK